MHSDHHAFKGWLAGKIIQKILNLLNYSCEYKLILSKKCFLDGLKEIKKYDVLHIECHSDQEGISCSPNQKESISWENLAKILSRMNIRRKQLVISGCLAGDINSDAKSLAKVKAGFKRVFAFAEEIADDKIIAVWSGFYYLISKQGGLNPSEFSGTVKKLRDCFDVNLVYFFPSHFIENGVGRSTGRTRLKKIN